MYPVCDGKPERITEGYGYREAKELRVFLSIECFELLFPIIILDNNISYADLEDAFDEDGYHRLWRGREPRMRIAERCILRIAER